MLDQWIRHRKAWPMSTARNLGMRHLLTSGFVDILRPLAVESVTWFSPKGKSHEYVLQRGLIILTTEQRTIKLFRMI